MSKPEKIFLLIIFILFFLLFHFNSITSPFERDEGEYAYAAMLLKEGKVPYKDVYTQKPPMIIYTYFLASLINQKAVWPPRVIAAIFTFLSAIIIGLIAKKNFGELGQWIAMFLSVPMLMFPVLTPFAANTEKFMILFFLLVLYLYVYFSNRDNLLIFLLSGIFSSIAIFYKFICLPILLFIFLIWFIDLKKKGEDLKKLTKKILFTILGFLLTTFLIFLPFILTKTLNYLWECIFIFNYYYAKNFGNPLINFYFYWQKFLSYWWILLPFLIFNFFKPFEKFWFYFGLFFFSLITVFSSPIGHYYLQVMPFLTLLITGSLVKILDLFDKDLRNFIAINFTVVILFFMIYPIRQQFYLNPQELVVWVYGRSNPFYEAPIVAEEIKKMLKTGDNIFVAGSEPQIYFYSQIKAPTRFVTSYYLTIESPFQKKYYKELINDLRKNQPKIIIKSNLLYSGLLDNNFLNEMIEKNYKLMGGFFWEDDKGKYLEKLNDKMIKISSLLVYLKNEK